MSTRRLGVVATALIYLWVTLGVVAVMAIALSIPFKYFRFLVIGITARRGARAAVAGVLPELPHRAVLPGRGAPDRSAPMLSCSPIRTSGPRSAPRWPLAAGMTLIAVPLGAVLAFLMVRTDVPGRHWLEPVILIPIFVSAVVIAFGYVVALGPVGFLSIRRARTDRLRCSWNLYSLPLADRHRRPDPCAARLSLHRGGAARARQRCRGGRARRGANPLQGRDRREPADGAAGDPVRRRAGVLPRLRAVRPAAGARRPAGTCWCSRPICSSSPTSSACRPISSWRSSW